MESISEPARKEATEKLRAKPRWTDDELKYLILSNSVHTFDDQITEAQQTLKNLSERRATTWDKMSKLEPTVLEAHLQPDELPTTQSELSVAPVPSEQVNNPWADTTLFGEGPPKKPEEEYIYGLDNGVRVRMKKRMVEQPWLFGQAEKPKPLVFYEKDDEPPKEKLFPFSFVGNGRSTNKVYELGPKEAQDGLWHPAHTPDPRIHPGFFRKGV